MGNAISAQCRNEASLWRFHTATLPHSSGIYPISARTLLTDMRRIEEAYPFETALEQWRCNMSKRAILIAAVAASAMTTYAHAADIVDTAASGGKFNTLVAAVKAAGLVETLKGSGPFTVFAPTDAAFEKLPPGTVQNLLKPENKEQLRKVLTYHVVPGKVMSSDLRGKKTTANSVEGSKIDIDASGNAVKVENATVTQADLAASNGIIHVIDTVIMPGS
jgi:uncharacterized surface protein with fasciclin (FAS1) repeats